MEERAMPDHSIHRASDLAGDGRLIVERRLGRALANDETISLNGSRAEDITDREMEVLLDEAFADVRSRRG
jgi:hypothetical protein